MFQDDYLKFRKRQSKSYYCKQAFMEWAMQLSKELHVLSSSLTLEGPTTPKDCRPQCQHRLGLPQCSEPKKFSPPLHLHISTQLDDFEVTVTLKAKGCKNFQILNSIYL